MSAPTAVTAHDAVAGVLDPEMPLLTLDDLGVVREVEVAESGTVIVTITPTYSGCPAMATIRDDIEHALRDNDFCDVEVRTRLQPAWSSDWITEAGRRKLVDTGYSVPGPAPTRSRGPVPLTLTAAPRAVTCPLCGSSNTLLTSEFGATLCKANYRCGDCLEPFEHVKEI